MSDVVDLVVFDENYTDMLKTLSFRFIYEALHWS